MNDWTGLSTEPRFYTQTTVISISEFFLKKKAKVGSSNYIHQKLSTKSKEYHPSGIQQ